MGRRTLLLITSILVAAVGTALIGLYVKGADTRATSRQTLQSVVVAVTSIPPGAKATQTNLEVQQWRSADLPDGYVSDLSAVIGKTATTQIYQKQAIQKPMFGSGAAATKTGISANHMGVSVELTDPERAAGLLAPGSHVNIFSIPNPGGNEEKVPDLILRNSVVIQIGNENVGSQSSTSTGSGQSSTSTTAGQDNVPRTVVSLDLTVDDATKLLKANANGTLYFAVLPPGGS
jgi:pilus assembly protein CpaB